jgi:uncharacterized membrane protein
MTSLTKNRIESIDLLKGLVMVIMALDHTRDYFHSAAFLFNPIDPTQSSLPIFFTRFITHFCAPAFCFLAGLSAYIIGKRKTLSELSIFLLKRGLWLIFIELTIVTFGWQFDIQFRINGFAVIAVLGASMIFLAGIIHLPRTFILIFSCTLIFGHNLLDTIHFPDNFLWAYIHEATIFTFSDGFKFYLDYPLIPWIAVMSLGYYLGSLYDKSFDSTKRKRILNTIGISSIVLFVVLRWSNIYGDPIQWMTFDSASKTLMSFLQISKYPPSLLFLLITLGTALLFLANTEHLKGRLVDFFCTFGRVPFFYYIIHIYVIHALAMLFAELSGFGWQLMILPDWILESPELKGYGFNLWVVYAVWFGVIISLYPLCKKFDNYKQAHKEKWWLSYL